MSLLFLLELDVVDKNFAVAGYANSVAFVEFADPAAVDCEPAFDDAATEIFTFESDFVEILRKASLSFRPDVGDIVEPGRDHIIIAAAEGTVRGIGPQN